MRDRLLGLGIIGLVLAVFGVTCTHGFVSYDDPGYVSENLRVLTGLTFENMGWALTTTSLSNWHPVVWWSWQLDGTLYGLKAWGYHLTNLLFHSANAWMLFAFLRRTTGAPWRSAAAACLFAVHPLTVEVVAWVSARKDLVSTFFLLLTLLAHVHYARRPSVAHYLLVVICFALGLMAKTMLVTVPVVLLLLDFWPLRRLAISAPPGEENGPGVGPARSLLEKFPLLLLALGAAAIVLVAQGRTSASGTLGQAVGRIPFACVFIVEYLRKVVWPFDLCIYYPYPQQPPPAGVWIGAAVGLFLATVTAVALARRAPYLLVGWLWFLITLLPVGGLIPIEGGQGVADRYAYVPLMGLAFLTVWGLADLGERLSVRPAAVVVWSGMLVACIVVTLGQITFWRDNLTLWRHALEVSPCSLTHIAVGRMLWDRGQLEAAQKHFEASLEDRPGWPPAHFTLAIKLDRLGQVKQAEKHFQAARESARLRAGTTSWATEEAMRQYQATKQRLLED